jgi:hypothetical protein
MKRVFDLWFECEDHHITVGNTKKLNCDAELWQYQYEKGKRKKSWTLKEKKTERSCGKHIVESGEIPAELDYHTVWDHRVAHAFCCGQALDAEFIIGIQKEISEIWKRLGDEDDGE